MNYIALIESLLSEIKPSALLAHQAITSKIEHTIRDHLAFIYNSRNAGSYLKKELRVKGGSSDLAFISDKFDLKSPLCLLELKQYYTEDIRLGEDDRSVEDFLERIYRDLDKYPEVDLPKVGVMLLIHIDCELDQYENLGQLFTYSKYFLKVRRNHKSNEVKANAIEKGRRYYQSRLKADGVVAIGEFENINVELIYFIVE